MFELHLYVLHIRWILAYYRYGLNFCSLITMNISTNINDFRCLIDISKKSKVLPAGEKWKPNAPHFPI